ncbi:MAG: hypothetical protein ACR2QM_02925 [Longimicrobiales bacterium]
MTDRTRLRTPFLAVLALAIGGAGVSAQESVSLMYTAEVKPAMLAEFQAAVMVHMQWRVDHNDPWTWNTFQVVNGSTLNQFKFRSGGHAWSDLDDYAAFQAEAAAHFRQVVSPYVEDLTSMLVVPTGINRTEVAGLRPMYSVTRYVLRSGQTAAFLGAVQQFHDAAGETGFQAEYNFETVANGGRGDVVRLVIPLDGYADLQEPSPTVIEMMISHLGQDDATEVFDQFNGAIIRADSDLSTHRPDLSTPPAN